MTDDAGRRYEHGPNLSATRLDDEIVILRPTSGDCYSLTGVGAFVWEVTTEARSFGSLVEAVTKRFDVSEKQASADVERFLAELRSEGLIVDASAS